jgi:hypothetical protein
MGFGAFVSNMASSASKAALSDAKAIANWTVEKTEAAYIGYQKGKEWAVEKGKTILADGLGLYKAQSQKLSATTDSFKKRITEAVNRNFGCKTNKKRVRKPKSCIQHCPVDEVTRKAETRNKRKKLIVAGKKSSNEDIVNKAKQLEKDMDAVENAKLSDHIYCVHEPLECNGDNSKVPGFKDVSRDEKVLNSLGIDKDDLKIPNSNFRAAVFQRENPPFSKEEAGYVVVFKGTSPGSTEDWQNDFRQGLNVDSSYYKAAVELGNSIGKKVGTPPQVNVSFAGHSLGGGLASAAATTAGLPANTFNAAGLHPATVKRYGGELNNQKAINAYNVEGDPLTKLQEDGVLGIGLPRAVGESDKVPRALEDVTPPKGKDDDYFHSMPVVIRAIERSKGANEEQLHSKVGG